jgi:hypothetical protein
MGSAKHFAPLHGGPWTFHLLVACAATAQVIVTSPPRDATLRGDGEKTSRIHITHTRTSFTNASCVRGLLT